MSSFLYVTDDENLKKINIDDLYENKKKRDLKQISIFNKILNRVQKRIELTARNKRNDMHIWFVIPEYIFGEPIYDKADCIAYIITKLESDKFHIRYVHPNTLFVSWEHWVPSYVRSEFKKKTGLIMDEHGQVVDKDDPEEKDSKLISDKTPGKTQKEYTPIGKYKPTGNLVYNPEIFEKIEKKITF
jgi:hypothetical protein